MHSQKSTPKIHWVESFTVESLIV